MNISEKAKKVLNISVKVVTWMLIAFTVFMMIFTIFTVSTVDKNERSIFGIRFYIVRSDSMSKSEKNADLDVHFNAGDIIMARELEDPTSLQPGDIISFLSVNTESYGETVTHMIREVRRDTAGKLIGYVTYGTNTGASDEKIVEPEYVLGQYAGKLVGVGNFFAFVKSTPGYIICILVPFLLLIAYNLFHVIRLFRQYKKEQNAAIEAERAEIAEERRRNEQMLRDLEALRAQLAGQISASEAVPVAEESAVSAEPVSEPAAPVAEESSATDAESENN